ncbi:hypothetical protein MTR_1g052420 [Medicago truncatula]|uniref:Uncharacterized protein n=1 Tax=Medicago truncatula TaxID=3880 RepID=A0A072VTX2_MEDTR|nr:hypothetical protein MTR_1g052420 [Medicago truncatula]
MVPLDNYSNCSVKGIDTSLSMSLFKRVLSPIERLQLKVKGLEYKVDKLKKEKGILKWKELIFVHGSRNENVVPDVHHLLLPRWQHPHHFSDSGEGVPLLGVLLFVFTSCTFEI